MKLFSKKIIVSFLCLVVFFVVAPLTAYGMSPVQFPAKYNIPVNYKNPQATPEQQARLVLMNQDAERARKAMIGAVLKADEVIGIYNRGKSGGVGQIKNTTELETVRRSAEEATYAANDAITQFNRAEHSTYIYSLNPTSSNDTGIQQDAANKAESDQRVTGDKYQSASQAYTRATGKTDAQIKTDSGIVDNQESCFNSVGIPAHMNQCLKDIVSTIAYIIIVVLSGILALAGLLLDKSIQYTIVDMAINMGNISSINIAWQILRDFANMFFIFILLYVAIRTILQVGQVDAKRTLVQIIITAILINFSIFFTKAFIDLSNILTLGFYQSMITVLPDGSNGSLSAGLMSLLNLGSIFNIGGSSIGFGKETFSTITTQWGTQGWSVLLGMSVGSIVLIFVTAFSFLAAAFLLIFRYFVLIFLIILSPLAFATYVLPETKDKYGEWFRALLGQAIFPVLYMMLMYVSIIIIKGSFKVGQLSEAIQAGTVEGGSGTSSMDIIISFSIAIFFINAALLMAKNYAGKVGGKAADFMKWGLGKIEATQKGVQGLAGRSAVRLSQVKRLDEVVKKSGIGNTYYGRIARDYTTGAVMGAKFGSGSSVSSIDKAQKTLNEAYARKQNENLEKEADKKDAQARAAVNIQSSKVYDSEQKLKAHQDAMKIEKDKLKKNQEFIKSKGGGDAYDKDVVAAEKESVAIEKRIKEMETQENLLKTGHAVETEYLEKRNKDYSTQKNEFLTSAQRTEAERLDRGILPNWMRSGARKETIKLLRDKAGKSKGGSGGKGKKAKDKTPEEIREEIREYKEAGKLDDLKETIENES